MRKKKDYADYFSDPYRLPPSAARRIENRLLKLHPARSKNDDCA